MDINVESIVKRKPVPGAKQIRTVLIGLIIVAAFLGISANMIFFIPALVLGGAFYYVYQNFEIEFEYLLDKEELVIDKVIMNSKRKHVLTVPLSQVVVVAAAGSPVLNQYDGLKEKNFTSNEEGGDYYAMICKTNKGTEKLALELNEEMRLGMKKALPGKMQ